MIDKEMITNQITEVIKELEKNGKVYLNLGINEWDIQIIRTVKH